MQTIVTNLMHSSWTCLHFLAPPNVSEDDELFDTKVILRQLGFFGPFPEKIAEIAAPVMQEINGLNGAVGNHRLVQKYRSALTASFDPENVNFLFSFMKVDPRDRPSARELLQHEWFSGV